MNESETPFDPREILIALVDHGVDFVVVGGVAVQAHGHRRSTGDLDIVPRPDILNLSRLGEALAALGGRAHAARASLDVTDPHLLQRVPQVALVTEQGRLDLLSVEMTAGAPATYGPLRERAVNAELDGRVVPIAGLDDLIRMKRIVGRDVDLSDIGALTRADEQLRDEAREST